VQNVRDLSAPGDALADLAAGQGTDLNPLRRGRRLEVGEPGMRSRPRNVPKRRSREPPKRRRRRGRLAKQGVAPDGPDGSPQPPGDLRVERVPPRRALARLPKVGEHPGCRHLKEQGVAALPREQRLGARGFEPRRGVEVPCGVQRRQGRADIPSQRREVAFDVDHCLWPIDGVQRKLQEIAQGLRPFAFVGLRTIADVVERGHHAIAQPCLRDRGVHDGRVQSARRFRRHARVGFDHRRDRPHQGLTQLARPTRILIRGGRGPVTWTPDSNGFVCATPKRLNVACRDRVNSRQRRPSAQGGGVMQAVGDEPPVQAEPRREESQRQIGETRDTDGHSPKSPREGFHGARGVSKHPPFVLARIPQKRQVLAPPFVRQGLRPRPDGLLRGDRRARRCLGSPVPSDDDLGRGRFGVRRQRAARTLPDGEPGTRLPDLPPRFEELSFGAL